MASLSDAPESQGEGQVLCKTMGNSSRILISWESSRKLRAVNLKGNLNGSHNLREGPDKVQIFNPKIELGSYMRGWKKLG